MPAKITVKRIAELPDDVGDSCDVSPDGKHHAYNLTGPGGMRAVVDGKKGPVCSHVQGPWYDDASGVLVYRENDGKKGAFHLGESVHSGYERAHNPTFSADGKRNAYGVRKGKSWYVVIDGKLQKQAFDSVGVDMAWSPDGTKLAYAAEKDGKQHVFVNGDPGRECIEPLRLAFNPDGSKVAYVCSAPPFSQYMVVCGDFQSPKFAVPASPGFSPSGELYYLFSPPHSFGYYVGEKLTETPRRVERVFFRDDGSVAGRVETLGRASFLILDGQPEQAFPNFRTALFAAPDRVAIHADKLTEQDALTRGSGREVLYFNGTETEEFDEIKHPRLLDGGQRVTFGARKGRELLWVEMA